MYSTRTAGNTDSTMAKARSLDHTRFIITGTGTSSQGRILYYGGPNPMSKMGDWATDLGGAKVYDDLNEARKDMKFLRDYHNSSDLITDGVKINFDVKLVQRKDVMIARLKYDGEKI